MDIRHGFSMLEKKEKKKVKLEKGRKKWCGVRSPAQLGHQGPYFNTEMMRSHLKVLSMDLYDLTPLKDEAWSVG